MAEPRPCRAEIPETPLDVERTLDAALGFELVELGDGVARGRIPVTDKVRQPFGLVHGGAYAALAETLASAGTFQAVSGDGMAAMGSSNLTSFLRPVTEGVVDAVATARHRGRTSWVWEVEFTDERGRLVALSRVTIAVRPMPGEARR